MVDMNTLPALSIAAQGAVVRLGTDPAVSLPGPGSPPLVTLWTAGLILGAGFTAGICILAIAEGVSIGRRRARALRTDPLRLLEPSPIRPAMRAACGAGALAVAALALAGLAVPVQLGSWGYRLSGLLVAVTTAAAGTAVFALLWRHWNRYLADVAMGLMTLSVCGFAAMLVPSEPEELNERYPLMFNAIVFALACMAWTWNWLGGVWEQQLDNGQAWTTAGRLVAPANDFSFQIAAVGLIIAFLMAGWPRLPSIGCADDSHGRVLFGVAGHLLLVLVCLDCTRRTRRTRFTRAAVLAVASLMIFIGVRAIG